MTNESEPVSWFRRHSYITALAVGAAVMAIGFLLLGMSPWVAVPAGLAAYGTEVFLKR